MERIEKIIWLIYKLKSDFSMRTFGERKWLQKIVLLAQELKFPLNYDFRWYRYGPYSSSLADDGYTMQMMSSDLRNHYICSDEMKQYDGILTRLRNVIETASNELEPLEEPEVVELLASLVFVAKYTYPQPSTRDDIFASLHKYKSFTFEQMEIAWNILEKERFVTIGEE